MADLNIKFRFIFREGGLSKLVRSFKGAHNRLEPDVKARKRGSYLRYQLVSARVDQVRNRKNVNQTQHSSDYLHTWIFRE